MGQFKKIPWCNFIFITLLYKTNRFINLMPKIDWKFSIYTLSILLQILNLFSLGVMYFSPCVTSTLHLEKSVYNNSSSSVMQASIPDHWQSFSFWFPKQDCVNNTRFKYSWWWHKPWLLFYLNYLCHL